MEEKNSKMAVELKEISPVMYEGHFKVPVEETRKEEEKTISRYSKKANIKGFRKGKAPVDVIKRRFKTDIEDTVVDTIVNDKVSKCVKENELRIVGPPILNEIKYTLGEQMVFSVRFDVMYDFDLEGLDDVRVKTFKIEVPLPDITDQLYKLRHEAKEIIPVKDEGISPGDISLIEGSLETTDDKQKKVQQDIIDRNHLIPKKKKEELSNVDKELLGLKKGEEKSFEVKIDDELFGKDIINRKARFNIKVKDIHRVELPELNDEFAKSVGEFDSLEDLKEDIRKALTEHRKTEERYRVASEILNKLREKNDIQIPLYFIERELERSKKELNIDGLDEEENRELVENLRKGITDRIARSMIVNRIVGLKNITVSEEEIDAEVAKYAKQNRANPNRLKKEMENMGYLDQMRNSLLYDKVVDFLLEINHIDIG